MSGRTLLASLAFLLAGCGLDSGESCRVICSACPRFATLEVSDAATGAAVAGVSVSGGGVPWTCTAATTSACTTFPLQPEAVPFDAAVSAPGHAAATVRFAPVLLASGNACCPPCPIFPAGQVQLAPL